MSVSVHILLRHQGVLGTSSKSRWGLLLGFSVAKGVVTMDPDSLGRRRWKQPEEQSQSKTKWQDGVPNAPSEHSGEPRKGAATHL